ncbi:MAG: deoxyuridine 5'-triphosphate nucleotidohydrolase [Eubacteriales bacterium]|nr:deoxyuridine 5'-triphosphate nucleotidohydrolase [Eubacteriales bacterium]
MENVTLKIKYHSDQIDKLTYIDGKSDWIDLRAAKRYELKRGDWVLIRLGVSIALPEGYEAHVVPRSSTFKTWGLLQTNSCGVIDNTYCGDDDEWMVPMLATRDTVVEINDRVCQFRIMKNQPVITFDEVEHLDGKSRGGFGTTGKQ